MKMSYLKYLLYVLEHKRNVFKTAWERGLYMHAITHDISKFNPKEFMPYANWFYGYHGVKLEKKYNKEQLNNNMSCLSRNYLECKKNFNKAWKCHYTDNFHHWQHWLDENEKPVNIPSKYIQQIIADWEGMALKFGDSAQNYYLLNYNKIKLTDDTRMTLEFELGLNLSIVQNYGHTLEQFYKMYSEKEFMDKFSWIEGRYNVNLSKILGGNNEHLYNFNQS